VAVAVEGKLDRSVSGKVLDVLGMDSPAEQQGEAGVAEIVPAYFGQPRSSQQGFEVPVHNVLSVEGSAFAGGEYEAVFLPVCACPNLPSSWRLRWLLRASTALWGKSIV
jgi:hypothetical protein